MRPITALRTLFLALLVSVVPSSSFAGIFVSVNIAPPALPVYVQPPCPGDGYLWTPGYWAYGDAGYFWVPGTWVLAPRPGVLWTPGYWGWGNGVYLWHAGYWGPHVGFYGGVNYGYGYGGVGFVGGRWEGGHFAYNTAVLHVDRTVIHNTYIDNTVIHNTTVINRTSFNGPHGIDARPNGQEMAAMHESHVQPSSEQMSHERFAGSNRENFASVNGGRPANAAVSRPMTSPNFENHAAMNNNNNRPAYNANNLNHQNLNANANNRPAFNANANNRPAYNNANASFKAPANNQAHYAPAPQPKFNEPAHQGGGQPQPHNESHPNNGGGGGHERR
jgi:WXXGXW repeat (2 copies)